jgi:hypothetical protein
VTNRVGVARCEDPRTKKGFSQRVVERYDNLGVWFTEPDRKKVLVPWSSVFELTLDPEQGPTDHMQKLRENVNDG